MGCIWIALNSGIFATPVRVLAIDPHDPSTVFASIGSSAQVFKSNDGGLTWRALTGLKPDYYVLAIHPRDSRIMYAGSWEGVRRTVDGGETWTLPGGPAINALAIDPQNPEIVYKGTSDSRVFKSTDGGQTWIAPAVTFEEVHPDGRKGCSPEVSSLAIDSQNPNKYMRELRRESPRAGMGDKPGRS